MIRQIWHSQRKEKIKGSFKISMLMRELLKGFNRFQGSESHTKQ